MARNGTAEISLKDSPLQLVGDREIRVQRTLSAPARVVFDAWTRPELVRRWWAPKAFGVEVVDCEADVRVGGKYRYVMHSPRGKLAFSGRYTEIEAPTRLVYTHVFEPMAAAGELTVTVTFAESAGRTHVEAHEVYPTKAVRDAALAGGAAEGRGETLNQLEELVVSLREGG